MSLDERIEYLEMKNRHQKKLRPWYKKTWGVLVIIVGILAICFIIAGSIYVAQQVQAIRSQESADLEAKEIAKITAAIDGRGESYSLGPIDAKVQIVIFSDFACPYCQQAAPVVRRLADKYKQDVRFTFRNYFFHNNSIGLALAANCAGEQGRFWEMHDIIFERQDSYSSLNDDSVKEPMKALAAELKFDTNQFKACLDDKKYLYRLNDDFTDAEILGLQGTPSWFINRYKITGFYPEENFINVIEGLIAK
ncbi:MAG: DsbA family protein [bacterium]|nr:DsbA family protein [bacterium]